MSCGFVMIQHVLLMIARATNLETTSSTRPNAENINRRMTHVLTIFVQACPVLFCFTTSGARWLLALCIRCRLQQYVGMITQMWAVVLWNDGKWLKIGNTQVSCLTGYCTYANSTSVVHRFG